MLFISLALLTSAALAGAADISFAIRADHSPRQDTSCQTECADVESCTSQDATDACCTTSVYNSLQSCLSCAVSAGALSQSNADTTLDAFAQSCEALGDSVSSNSTGSSTTSTAGQSSTKSAMATIASTTITETGIVIPATSTALVSIASSVSTALSAAFASATLPSSASASAASSSSVASGSSAAASSTSSASGTSDTLALIPAALVPVVVAFVVGGMVINTD